MKQLSSKQTNILEYLRNFREEKDYPPTIRDILKGCNISSTSVVDYNLRVLEREGFIRRDREISRGIELVNKERKKMIRIPLMGNIAAGKPIFVPSSDNWRSQAKGSIEVSSDLIKGKEDVYALKVKGNSMIDALISDGDVVLMQQAATVEDGDMVAAWLKSEEETTLKKLYRERGRIRLQPANTQMKPIYADSKNVEVQGRVLGVIREVATS